MIYDISLFTWKPEYRTLFVSTAKLLNELIQHDPGGRILEELPNDKMSKYAVEELDWLSPYRHRITIRGKTNLIIVFQQKTVSYPIKDTVNTPFRGIEFSTRYQHSANAKFTGPDKIDLILLHPQILPDQDNSWLSDTEQCEKFMIGRFIEEYGLVMKRAVGIV